MGIAPPSVCYHQTCAKALTAALNDTSDYGLVMRGLLSAHREHLSAAAGSEIELRKHAPVAICLRRMVSMQRAGLHLTDHGVRVGTVDVHSGAGDLARWVQQHLSHDPTALGQTAAADPSFLRPLFRLGVRSIHDVLEPSGLRVISSAYSAALKAQFGHACRPEHMLALNRLTVLMHSEPGCDYRKHVSTAPLPAQQRTIPDCLLPHIAPCTARAASRRKGALTRSIVPFLAVNPPAQSTHNLGKDKSGEQAATACLDRQGCTHHEAHWGAAHSMAPELPQPNTQAAPSCVPQERALISSANCRVPSDAPGDVPHVPACGSGPVAVATGATGAVAGTNWPDSTALPRVCDDSGRRYNLRHRTTRALPATSPGPARPKAGAQGPTRKRTRKAPMGPLYLRDQVRGTPSVGGAVNFCIVQKLERAAEACSNSY